MEYKNSFDSIYELEELVWSGAKDTVKRVIEFDKGDELISYLEEIFCDDVPTLTEINDVLWLETDSIDEYLGIQEVGIEVSINNVDVPENNYIDKNYKFIGEDLYYEDDLIEEDCKRYEGIVSDVIIEREKANGTVMLIETDEGDIIYENEDDEDEDEEE